MNIGNRIYVPTNSIGTGDIVLSGAVDASFLTFAEAGVVDGTQDLPYVLLQGTNVEVGLGTYHTSGPSFSRNTVRVSKIGGTAGTSKINLTSGGARLMISVAAEDYLAVLNYNAADVLSKLLTVDGSGSGLDADKLDGNEATAFQLASGYTAADVLTKIKTVDGTGSGLDADTVDGVEASTLAPLASPTLTGTPAAPTAAVGTNTTQLATTAFVAAAVALCETLGKTAGRRTVTDSTTLQLDDAGKMVVGNKGTAMTITVPPNSSVAFPTETYVNLAQYGVGQVTIAAGSGVTIRATPGLKLSAQYAMATITKIGTDEWWLGGNLAA